MPDMKDTRWDALCREIQDCIRGDFHGAVTIHFNHGTPVQVETRACRNLKAPAAREARRD